MNCALGVRMLAPLYAEISQRVFTENPKRMALRFLLAGRVQEVKMRRYIESAARHFAVSGFTINTTDGNVYGEARSPDVRASAINLNEGVESPIDKFETWLRGEWQPRTFTDVKPTPVGVAYPALASVTAVVIDRSATASALPLPPEFKVFTMVRGDDDALALEERLVSAPLVPAADARGWPPREE